MASPEEFSPSFLQQRRSKVSELLRATSSLLFSSSIRQHHCSSSSLSRGRRAEKFGGFAPRRGTSPRTLRRPPQRPSLGNFPSAKRRLSPDPGNMDVFLMIRRKKTTLFLDAKENTSVGELKRMIEGITKTPPNQQKLYNRDDVVMDDEKTLAEYGLTSTLAKAQSPAEVGLAFNVDGSWEELEKTPYSSPPELPDVMKPGQEATAQEAATA